MEYGVEAGAINSESWLVRIEEFRDWKKIRFSIAGNIEISKMELFWATANDRRIEIENGDVKKLF